MNITAALFIGALLAAPASSADRPIPVSSFETLRVEGDFRIILVTDTSPSLTAQGALEDLHDFEASVQGGQLTIKQNVRPLDQTRPRGLVTLRIGARSLQRIELTGSSSLETQRLTETALRLSMTGPVSANLGAIDIRDLNIAMQGPASVTASGKVAMLDLQMLGPATLDGGALEARGGRISTGGPASVRLDHRGPFVVTAYGQSQIDMVGNGQCRRERGTSAAQVRGCDN